MNTKNEDERPMPSFPMPSNLKMNMDEDEEEVTRKIGPTMVMPSLGPLPVMPSEISSSSLSTISTIATKTSLRKQQEKTTVPFTWKLHEIPVLPEFHVLERSAVFVPRSEPFEVASRISDILRMRSIEAQYENGKAKVKCTTMEGIEFRIRLYRGRGRYSHGIIVEVQRRFGNSFTFHSDTQAILNGAQGKTVTHPPLSSSRLPEVSDVEESDGEESSISIESASSSLAMVSNMMKLPGFDAQYLGLQTLSALVDSDRLTISVARTVSASLLEEESEVGNVLFEYILKKNMKRKSPKQGVFEEDDDDEEESFATLRNMSLNILSNAIKANGKVPDNLRDPFRSVFLKDLHDAESHPNTAFMAAKCLEYLIVGDQHSSELKTALQIAAKVGEARHTSLMLQARKCLYANDHRHSHV